MYQYDVINQDQTYGYQIIILNDCNVSTKSLFHMCVLAET